MVAGLFRTWRTRSIDAWDTLQIELHGYYSVERLLALQNYSNTVSVSGLAALVLLTPLPCLITVILADLAPLNAPEAGTDSNIVFWLRGSVVVWFFTLSFVVQFHEMMPRLPMSRSRGFGITIFVSTGVMLYCYSLSHIIGFPVPFLMVMGAPVWTTLLLSSFAISWMDHVRADRKLQGQIVDGLKVFVIQMSMIVIYPFYNYGFTKLSYATQAAFSLLLQVIKMTIKYGISRYIRSQTDMKPEVVIFNVEVFNALFVSFCMQNSTSKLTIAVIMVADFVHMSVSLREVLLMLRKVKEVEKRLDLAEALVRCPESAVNLFKNSLSRACSVLIHTVECEEDAPMLNSPMFPNSHHANFWCFIRASKIRPQAKAVVPAPHLKSQENRGAQPTDANPKAQSQITSNPQRNLEAMKSLYVQRVANLLHLVEFTILVE